MVVLSNLHHAGVYSALGLLDEGELPDHSELSVESDYDDESEVQDDDDSSSRDEADKGFSPPLLVEDILQFMINHRCTEQFLSHFY